MLKSIEDIEKALDMLMQETDASQRTKGRHELEYQFRMALDRIAGLERTNKRLRNELEQYPEYQQQQALKSVVSYVGMMNI